MQDVSQDIILKAADGDLDAFEMIFRFYSNYVFNVALRTAQSREDAEEITQEVFMTVYRKLESFRYQSSLKTWIYRITVNMTLNYLKKEAKHKNKAVEYDENFEPQEVKNDVKALTEKEYKDCLIERLLNYLTPEQKICIVLRNVEGLSYEEIAQSLKIDINAVRSRLKRAREKLLSLKKEEITHGLC